MWNLYSNHLGLSCKMTWWTMSYTMQIAFGGHNCYKRSYSVHCNNRYNNVTVRIGQTNNHCQFTVTTGLHNVNRNVEF